MTCGWKSRPANAVAGRPEPSLAGGVATHRPKRRQGSCGVRAESPERMKVVEAEAVPVAEGSMCAVAKRDGDAPPGSQAASRTKSRLRDPGDPTGAVGVVTDGVRHEGKPECSTEPRSGVGPIHSTDDAAEGNEACRGKGSARREPAGRGQGPDTEPGRLAAKPRAGERGSQAG